MGYTNWLRQVFIVCVENNSNIVDLLRQVKPTANAIAAKCLAEVQFSST